MLRRTMNFGGLFGGALLLLAACGGVPSPPPPTPSSAPEPPPTQQKTEDRLGPRDLAVSVSDDKVKIVLTQKKECRPPSGAWNPCGGFTVDGEEITLLFEPRPLTVKTGSGGEVTINLKDEYALRKLIRRSPTRDGDDDDVDEEEDWKNIRRVLRNPIVVVTTKDAESKLDLSQLSYFATWKEEQKERARDERDERRYQAELLRQQGETLQRVQNDLALLEKKPKLGAADLPAFDRISSDLNGLPDSPEVRQAKARLGGVRSRLAPLLAKREAEAGKEMFSNCFGCCLRSHVSASREHCNAACTNNSFAYLTVDLGRLVCR